MINFKEYQKRSRKTAKYPNVGNDIIYPTLGLNGEAGEVAEKVKKIIRDKKGEVSDEDRREIGKELGDVLWYLSQLATELDFSLEEIAEENIKKIFSRMKRRKLAGSGDNR
jgi:NTP pyrophosphatase (non-canonical NTP hydrolase)